MAACIASLAYLVSWDAAAAPMSAEQAVLIEQNPALADVAEVAPAALTEIFSIIETALANPSDKRGGIEALDPETVKLFGRNPALLQVWQSSPEASADLLQLIRTAAGGGKQQK